MRALKCTCNKEEARQKRHDGEGVGTSGWT